MKLRTIFTLSAVGLLAAGCSKEALPFGPGYTSSPNSISSYTAPKMAEATITYYHEATGSAGDGQAAYDKMQINFYAGGVDPRQSEPYLVQNITSRSDAARYDSLTKAHQDYDYNYDPRFTAYDVLFRGIKSLTITSDTDYDPQHPAGTSLNDIFSLSVDEVVKGVVNGYQGYVFQEKEYPTVNGLQGAGPHLLSRVLVLKPNKAPSVTSTHVFSLVFENEDGYTLVTHTKAFKIKVEQ